MKYMNLVGYKKLKRYQIYIKINIKFKVVQQHISQFLQLSIKCDRS